MRRNKIKPAEFRYSVAANQTGFWVVEDCSIAGRSIMAGPFATYGEAREAMADRFGGIICQKLATQI
jgi:hypothetical protein